MPLICKTRLILALVCLVLVGSSAFGKLRKSTQPAPAGTKIETLLSEEIEPMDGPVRGYQAKVRVTAASAGEALRIARGAALKIIAGQCEHLISENIEVKTETGLTGEGKQAAVALVKSQDIECDGIKQRWKDEDDDVLASEVAKELYAYDPSLKVILLEGRTKEKAEQARKDAELKARELSAMREQISKQGFYRQEKSVDEQAEDESRLSESPDGESSHNTHRSEFFAAAKTKEEAERVARASVVGSLESSCVVPNSAKVTFSQQREPAQGLFAVLATGVGIGDCEAEQERLGKEEEEASASERERVRSDDLKADLKADLGPKMAAAKVAVAPLTGQALESDQFKKRLAAIVAKQAKINEANQKVQNAKASIEIKKMYARERAIRAKDPTCYQAVEDLMADAQSEALNNYPPGNLAQGRAAVLWNRAQRRRQQCKH